jgi:hypothetical protein
VAALESVFGAAAGFGLQGLAARRAGTLQFRFGGFPWTARRDSVVASEDTMRPKKHETTMSGDLFRARLDQIINLKHELVQLAGRIDWGWIDGEIARSTATRVGPGSRRAS